MQNRPAHSAQRLGAFGGVVLCVLAGLIQALSAGWTATGSSPDAVAFEHPLLEQGSWMLQVLAASLFYLALAKGGSGSARSTALLAGTFGLTWQSAGTWWLFIGMHSYAGLAAPWAAAAVLALAAYLGLYTVLAGLAFSAAARSCAVLGERWPALGVFASAAAFAGAWLLAELGRAMVMRGFPWASAGYAHLQGPFTPLFAWVGVYGVAAASAFAAALMAQLMLTRAMSWPWRGALAAALTATLALSLNTEGAEFTQSAGEFEVRLLQGNVSQDSKFQASHVARAMDWYTRELARSDADVAMAPETALPVLPEHIPRAYWERLERRAKDQPGVLLLGVPQPRSYAKAALQNEPSVLSNTNTLLGLGHPETLLDPTAGSASDTAFRYDKQHLVPFAEFTPWGFAWFTRLLDLPLPSFESGTTHSKPLRIRTKAGQTQSIATLICYEDLFGEDFAPAFKAATSAPTAFANASNLAWFDDSPAIAQHLRFAQARSLEFQRPTFRATNTGPTVVINHRGQVIRALPPQTEGMLNAVVEGRSGATPYAYWLSRWGLWPLVPLALLLLAAPGLLAAWQSGIRNRA
jgi:apolipoprotein N-acyltransferase